MNRPESSAARDRGRWRGDEIQEQRDWCIELERSHVDELLGALAAVTSGPDGAEVDLMRISTADFELPSLAPLLDSALDELIDGRGFVLIRGVPIEGLTASQLEILYWGLGQHIGIPIPQNDAGSYLVHVRDEGLDFSNREVRAYQTAARLDYHSDSSDIVGLLCVRPAMSGGVSTIVSAAAVYHEAVSRRPDLVPLLEAPWWWDRRRKDLSASFFPCRIFATDRGSVTSYYGRAHIESAQRGPGVPPLSDRQIEALDLIDSIVAEPGMALDMDFQPGDIQFLDNYRVWHARTDYVDWPSAERKRDLYRLWLTTRRPLDLPADFAARGITARTAAFDRS